MEYGKILIFVLFQLLLQSIKLNILSILLYQSVLKSCVELREQPYFRLFWFGRVKYTRGVFGRGEGASRRVG